jgi:hypothetical protein
MTRHHADQLTFAKFIMSRHVTDTPRGDFIDDSRLLIKLDKLPAIQKRSELDAFLWGRGAAPVAVLAGRKLWGEYKRARNRQQRRAPNADPKHLYQPTE